MQNWLKGNLSKIKDSLFKTRRGVLQYIPGTDDVNIGIGDEFYNDLTDKFIKADVGIDFSEKIVSDLKSKIKLQKINKNELQETIKNLIKNIAKPVEIGLKPISTVLNIYLIVGVNGSGKTTTIGKLAKRFKDEGLKVLIIQADTFRAAAGEQLLIWANKAGVEIYSPPEIKKPDAVVFSGIEKAKRESYNVVLIDTAGRLHSQTNLMDELKKIDSVIKKNAVDSIKENLIVLDATIGQNAIVQAELFSKAIGLTGIILGKLDSSAKGGVVLNIMDKLSLPVKLIGTGEKIDDLAGFNLDEYLEGLLS